MEYDRRIGILTPFFLKGAAHAPIQLCRARSTLECRALEDRGCRVDRVCCGCGRRSAIASARTSCRMSEQASGETARAEQILANAGFKTAGARACSSSQRTLTRRRSRFPPTVQRVLTKLRDDAAGDEPAHRRCRPDLEGPARAADRVRHEGQPGHRRRAGAAAARCRRRPAAGEPAASRSRSSAWRARRTS